MSLARTHPSKRLREGLTSRLFDRLVLGKLKPGAKIIESRLAAELRVSRTPLREALLQLEREGLVRSDLRRGFTVEPLSAREVRETYPILAALECLAVRNSAALLPSLLPDLQRTNRGFAAARSAEEALELDTRWHETLMSQSRNSRLAALVHRLRLLIRRYEYFYMADTRLVATSAGQHRAIISAIKSGDVDETLKAIEVNYLFGMDVLLRKMGEE
jgi:DNA-binding GntR family transcriptional regulator